ncbi:MAG: uracil-DNA glycosylase [Flavobacteriaceae bacterium]|nr:uracil-DNA glycosylase [Flavobacteriaceae bacterium]MDG1912164.1 uracil-DNA glycosylase [Flavobacteriaceae bacterium]
MTLQIHSSWEKPLQTEFESFYFRELTTFLTMEYQNHSCYPAENFIFNAFEHCHYHQVKIVLLGQDPYHGAGQAHGLSFSVPDGIKHPPSLVNVFKEVEHDLGIPYPTSGNLERWAKQGVLLLNASLSVREGEAGSHQKKGWETLTDAVIQKLSENKEGLVFLLWGGFAKQKAKFIDPKKHLILTARHPSPLSANRGYWFGNKHFSQCNRYLKTNGKTPIDW